MDIDELVEILMIQSGNAKMSSDALTFSQAALNLAQTVQIMHSIKK